jgi:hypothetical protein
VVLLRGMHVELKDGYEQIPSLKNVYLSQKFSQPNENVALLAPASISRELKEQVA